VSYTVHGAPPNHLGWLVERVHYAPTIHLKAFEAVDKDGQIVGMIGFDNWMPNSVEMHLAIEKPMSIRLLAPPAFRFAFEIAQREYIIALAPASRSKVLEWGIRIGFKEIHRLKDGCAKGDDLVYAVLHRDDCTWFRANRKAA
jgi:hypothetical protein